MDRTHSGFCPMEVFHISDVEPQHQLLMEVWKLKDCRAEATENLSFYAERMVGCNELHTGWRVNLKVLNG